MSDDQGGGDGPAHGAEHPQAADHSTQPGHGVPPGYGVPPAYGTQPAYGAQPAYGVPPAYAVPPAPDIQPSYGQQSYGQPPYRQPGYGQQPYGASYPAAPGYGYGYAPVQTTNGLSIAAMILSIAGVVWMLPIIGSLAGAILGHVSLRQIAQSGQRGRGMALAGVIIGWVGVALSALGIIAFIWFVAWSAQHGGRWGTDS